MPEDSREIDSEIIRTAYADRVTDAFRVFAENIGMGQDEKSCTERFTRSMYLIRRARDLALDAIGTSGAGHPAAGDGADGDAAKSGEPKPMTPGLEGLSPEDRAIIEQALAGTTGRARR